MNRHLILNRILHEPHRQLAVGLVPVAGIQAARVRGPDALARGRGGVEEAEFAVEEEFGEAGPGGYGAVVFGEAEGVGVSV